MENRPPTTDSAFVQHLKARHSIYIRLGILLGSWGLVVALLVYFDLHRVFLNESELKAFISSFDSNLGALVFLLIQMAQVLVAPMPGEVTGFAGGYVFGSVRGFSYSTVGLTIGSVIAFFVARRFGRPAVERWARPDTLQKYDFLVDHRGKWIAFVLFLIPGFPKDLFCYLLGTSHMSFRMFFVISTVGRSLGTALLSFSGELAKKEQYWLFGILLAVAGTAAFLSYIYRERWLAWIRAHHFHHHDHHHK